MNLPGIGTNQLKIIEMIRAGIKDGSIRGLGGIVPLFEMPPVRYPNNMFSNLRKEKGQIKIEFHPERFFNDYGANI